MEDKQARTLLFEGFRLNLSRSCLLGPGGIELALGPKTFDLFHHLVEKRGSACFARRADGGGLARRVRHG